MANNQLQILGPAAEQKLGVHPRWALVRLDLGPVEVVTMQRMGRRRMRIDEAWGERVRINHFWTTAAVKMGDRGRFNVPEETMPRRCDLLKPGLLLMQGK